MKKLFAVCVIATLSGCSSWQAGKSVSTNWYKIGYSEAQSGYTANWRENYHLVYGGQPEAFNPDQYREGFQDGLKSHCLQKKCVHSPQLAEQE